MPETIISKRCSKCKDIKSISEFHKYRKGKDRLQSYCKTCEAIYQTKYRKTAKGRTAHCKANKKYNTSKKGKVADKSSNARRPNQIKAVNAVNHAITAEKLPRPNTLECYYCFEKARQYHHPSYAPEHWLDVIPVCRECHYKCDRKIA